MAISKTPKFNLKGFMELPSPPLGSDHRSSKGNALNEAASYLVQYAEASNWKVFSFNQFLTSAVKKGLITEKVGKKTLKEGSKPIRIYYKTREEDKANQDLVSMQKPFFTALKAVTQTNRIMISTFKDNIMVQLAPEDISKVKPTAEEKAAWDAVLNTYNYFYNKSEFKLPPKMAKTRPNPNYEA